MTHLESRFTAPSAECPSPQYWTSDDADSTEHEVSMLVEAYIVALQPEYVVETGSAFGQTAEAIGTALAANGHGTLDTIELDPKRHQMTSDRCLGLPQVRVHQMSSLDFEPAAPIDFAWFDSLLHLRAPEFRRYHPFMHRRTVVAFHDTGSQHPLRPELEALEREGLLVNPHFLPTPRGVCFARVGGTA